MKTRCRPTSSAQSGSGVSPLLHAEPRRLCHRAHSGFTLVEVLAALLLIGIILPAIMEGISLSQRAGAVARTSLEATALAESKLNEIVASGQWNATTGSGDFGDDHPGYRWELQVNDRDYSVSEIDVRVTWKVRLEERSVNVSTLVYNTANSTTSGSSGSTSSGAQR